MLNTANLTRMVTGELMGLTSTLVNSWTGQLADATSASGC